MTIPLDSIETGIPIRNERMAEYLFQTDKYPEATIEASVPAALLEAGSHLAKLDASLTLHGQTRELTDSSVCHRRRATHPWSVPPSR